MLDGRIEELGRANLTPPARRNSPDPFAGSLSQPLQPKKAADAPMSEEEAKAKCSKGDLHVCVEVGMFYEDQGSYADAPKYYQNSCNKGEMEGCSRLGWLYQRGWGVKEDRRRAVEFTQKACDAGEMYGCYLRGGLYETDLTNIKDSNKRALELYERACTAGRVEACHELGMVYQSGRSGAGKDLDRAKVYLEKRVFQGTACLAIRSACWTVDRIEGF
jgi:hypothetical protein